MWRQRTTTTLLSAAGSGGTRKETGVSRNEQTLRSPQFARYAPVTACTVIDALWGQSRKVSQQATAIQLNENGRRVGEPHPTTSSASMAVVPSTPVQSPQP